MRYKKKYLEVIYNLVIQSLKKNEKKRESEGILALQESSVSSTFQDNSR